ncbi:hypothetical protein [Legionella sp.]|uniref:hypothetical protein n=1 Tax=Legionella sp. TaxID=459 RepID=UPI003CBAF074
MLHNSGEGSSIEHRKLVFLLAIAGRIDTQQRLLAKKLNKERYIYHAYNVLDSLSSSYSMFKYFFEVFISNTNDPVLMRELMLSPEGVIVITGEALFLVTFSFLASYYDGKKQNDDIKRLIVWCWPYFRDVMKGMKNAYKGWKTAVQILSPLSGGADLKFMIIPLGLALGVLASVNRIWIRAARDECKKMIAQNENFLDALKKISVLNAERHELILRGKDLEFEEQIRYQSSEKRIFSLIASGMGGFIDGLYLYAGLVSLSILPPAMFLAMVAVSAFYILVCVISRVYEEYDNQLKLFISQTNCKLILVSKELETTYANLQALQNKATKDEECSVEIADLKMKVANLIGRFDELHLLLKSQTMDSPLTAGLLGMKNGLFAYGVLASFLFMFTAVLYVNATVFPPALLIACILSGLVLIIGVGAYNINAHSRRMQSLKKEEDEPFRHLVEMKNNIRAAVDPEFLPAKEFKDPLAALTTPLPKNNFQEWFEVLRSFFSGLSKGNNFAIFVSTPLHNIDPTDHESSARMIIVIISAALFSIVLALRAFARGFKLSKNKADVDDTSAADSLQTGIQGKSSTDKNPSKLPPSNSSFLRYWSIFNPLKTEFIKPSLVVQASCT